jgi:hypothetical protein
MFIDDLACNLNFDESEKKYFIKFSKIRLEYSNSYLDTSYKKYIEKYPVPSLENERASASKFYEFISCILFLIENKYRIDSEKCLDISLDIFLYLLRTYKSGNVIKFNKYLKNKFNSYMLLIHNFIENYNEQNFEYYNTDIVLDYMKSTIIKCSLYDYEMYKKKKRSEHRKKIPNFREQKKLEYKQKAIFLKNQGYNNKQISEFLNITDRYVRKILNSK